MSTLALFAGIALFILACNLAAEAGHFSHHSLPTKGEIVGVRESGGTQTGFSFHPVVRFTTKEHQVVSAVADEPMAGQYVVGQKVEVFYDPRKPSQVQLGTRSGQWGPVLLVVFLGGVLFTVGVTANPPRQSASPTEQATRRAHLLSKLVPFSLCALGLVEVLGVATTLLKNAQEERGIKAMRRTCAGDADCPATFCDRGRCAPNLGETPHFGTPCTPSTAAATGKERGDAATCGPFVCFAGRCQSCAKDAECQPGAEWAQQCLGPYWGLSACADHPGDMNP